MLFSPRNYPHPSGFLRQDDGLPCVSIITYQHFAGVGQGINLVPGIHMQVPETVVGIAEQQLVVAESAFVLPASYFSVIARRDKAVRILGEGDNLGDSSLMQVSGDEAFAGLPQCVEDDGLVDITFIF